MSSPLTRVPIRRGRRAACAAVTLCLCSAGSPMAGQGPGALPARPPYVPPRTPWGEPDLQGLWTSDDMRGVPRERPAEFGSRPFLTDDEFLERIEQDERTQRQQLRGPYGARNDLRSRTFRA